MDICIQVPLVEQELLTFLEHLSGVLLSRSLALCVCFVDRCLSVCSFSFGHCVVCSSSIYGSWLPLWYLQTLLWTELVPSHSLPFIQIGYFVPHWFIGWLFLTILSVVSLCIVYHAVFRVESSIETPSYVSV
jgi:hypothetical protein